MKRIISRSLLPISPFFVLYAGVWVHTRSCRDPYKIALGAYLQRTSVTPSPRSLHVCSNILACNSADKLGSRGLLGFVASVHFHLERDGHYH